MAFQKSVSNPYNSISESAYIMIESFNMNFRKSVGSLTMSVWDKKEIRNDGSKFPIGTITMRISPNGEVIDSDGVISNLSPSIVKEIRDDIYTYLSDKKISMNGDIIDLSTAEDVLE